MDPFVLPVRCYCGSSIHRLSLNWQPGMQSLYLRHLREIAERSRVSFQAVLPGCPSRLSFQAVFYDCHISQVAQNFFTYVAIALNYSVKNI